MSDGFEKGSSSPLGATLSMNASSQTSRPEDAHGGLNRVVARFIHRASPQKDGPFVAINCAALPETLLESELFGYDRGAFTGAHQSKAGQIELASAGVLFLDELCEMSRGAGTLPADWHGDRRDGRDSGRLAVL